MAKLDSGFTFTGSLGVLSAYRMKGSDKIILRRKGGASKKRIQKDPNFINTRRINAEFGARASASSYVMMSMGNLKRLADYNIAGPINALLRPLQLMDDVNDWGERDILFSKRPKLLEGFSLNKQNPFDSIVRGQLPCTISKENYSAHVSVPQLRPRINLFVPGPYKQPFYRIAITYGMIPDVSFVNKQYYYPEGPYFKTTRSDWFPVTKGSKAFDLDVTLKPAMKEKDISMYSHLITVGIEFGMPVGGNEVDEVPYKGAAKIMVMV